MIDSELHILLLILLVGANIFPPLVLLPLLQVWPQALKDTA